MKPTPRDVRWLVDQLDDQKRRLQNLENRKPGLAYSSIEDGAIREYDKDGILGSQTGKQSDGTHGNVVLNGPKPPRPTDADVTAVPGMLEMRWNGKFADAAVSPLDLKHVAGYVVPVGDVLDLSKQAGVMTGELGDNVQVQVEAGVYNVYLVAWSKAGRFSDAAGPVPVLVPVAADMDAIQEALDDLDERYDGVITEAGQLGARLDLAETDIVAAESRLDTAGTRLDDAFGQISTVDGKATAAAGAASTAQSKADSALTMAGSATKAYYSTSTPSGVARTDRDVWRQINAVKDVIGEWFWDGTLSTPGWVKTLISSQSISNLDVGKLTVGTGIISDLVAEHIAGRSARFLQLDVSQLVAVTGTMSEAVITKLFTDVVMSRKITTQMLAIGSFDNLIPGGNFLDRAAWDGNSRLQLVAGQSELGGPVGRFDGRASISSCYEALDNNSLPVVPLSSYRIRGRVRSNVDAPAASVRVMMRFEVGPGAYTYPTASAPALVAGQWAQVDAVVTAPANALGRRFALNVQATFPAGAYVDFSDVSATRMSDGELIVDGSLKARHADLESFAANTGFIADLTARIVKSDMFVGKEFHGGIFTGSTFQTNILPNVGMKLDDAGLRAYGPEGGEPVVEVSPTGGKALGVSDAVTGEVLGGIDSEGNVSAKDLAVSGEARIDGVLVAGGDPLNDTHLGGSSPGSLGPVLNGRSLLGKVFANLVDDHPMVTDLMSWLDVIPHGVICNAWRGHVGTLTWRGLGSQEHSRIMMTATAQFVEGRAYSISYRAPGIRQIDTLTQGTVGYVTVRASSAGGSITPGGAGATIPGTMNYLASGGEATSVNGITYIRCPEDLPAGKVMLGVEATCYADQGMQSVDNVNSNRWEVVVTDMGLRNTYNAAKLVDLGKQGTAPPTPAPAPEPDPIREYVDTVNATWWQAYEGGGGQATHSTYNGSAAQGRTPYAPGNGVMRGMIGIPSQASRLSGATVKKIEVYVYAKAWHASAGGTICIGTHDAASKPGTWSSSSNDIKRQKMKRPEGRWITLPPSTHNGFKNGVNKGITMLPPGSSTSTEYYGLFTGSKTKFRFTYTR